MMRGEHILVIDDELPVTTLLGRRLEQEGFTCQLAYNAEEALQYLREDSFAAALVDVRMPGRDGIALLEELKALDPDLAAIMVTAIKDRESAVRAMRLGAEDYIVKPFDLDEVVTSLRRALDTRRLTLENRAYHQELERLVAERTYDLERRNAELAALNRRLGTLREIGASMVSTLSLDEVLQRIADGLVAGLEYRMVLIGVVDHRSKHAEKEQILRHVVMSGAAQDLSRWAEELAGMSLSESRSQSPGKENLIRQVVEERRTQVTRDLYEVLRPAVAQSECEALQRQIDALSLVVIPLQARERMVGAIVIAAGYEEVDLEELLQLQTFADQAAIAIENARLYQGTLAAQQRSATILLEAFAGVVVVDANLCIREFNPAAEAITGYQAREVLGHPLWQLFGDELYGEESLLNRAITSGEQILPTETSIAGRRGRRDILLGVTPLPGEDSTRVEYLLSFADITDLKEVERLKTNIVANVSHELRTPLASIRAYAELLMDNLDEGDEGLRQRFLGVIDQETQHLADLITDLLNVARLESGRFEPHRESISLRDIAVETLARFRIQAQQRGIQLSLDAPLSLPHLPADREMMGVLLKNLVDNAVKFSTHGGEVKVSLQADEERQILTVTDQGIGIAPEDLSHIFEKFYRAHSSIESGFEGAGLGLTLVSEVVDAHDGSIEVQSKIGKGTCFTIALPMKPPPAGNEGP